MADREVIDEAARQRPARPVTGELINHGPVPGVMVYVNIEQMAKAGEVAPSVRARVRSEVALVERARDGDHQAFAELLDLRLDQTFRTAMAILGDETEARDATQAIFIQAWTRLSQLRDPALFSAWFGRIVVNTARSALRGRRRRTLREIHAASLPVGEGPASSAPTPEARAAELDRIERAFERLSPDERAVLWLHHYEDLSLAEIGKRTGVPPRTVKSRLFTARRALERSLQVEDR
jgi:RNA polymerase sigma-70 factor, ECF subfamily